MAILVFKRLSGAEQSGFGRALQRLVRSVRPAVIVCILMCGAALLSPAFASADVEPNNAIWQAETPAPAPSFTGSVPPGDVADWYAFTVEGQQQIHLTTKDSTNGYGGDCTTVNFVGPGGNVVNDDFTTAVGTSVIYVEAYATRNTSCSTYNYEFSISPAVYRQGPPALAPVSTGEPNESASEATGPISGGVLYRGTIDTSNDADEFYFVTAPGQQQISITAYIGAEPTEYPFDLFGYGEIETPTCNGNDEPSLSLWESETTPKLTGSLDPANPYGIEEQDPSAASLHLARWSFTTSGTQRLYVRETGRSDHPPCNEWLFRIDPASAILSAHDLRCRSQEERIRRLRAAVRRSRKALHRSRSSAAAKRAAMHLHTGQKALETARAAARGCVPSN